MPTAKDPIYRFFEDGPSVPTADLFDDADTVRVLFLGYILERGKVRRILGPYLEEERGHASDSPCYVWLGPFKHGRPYITTHYTSRSVLKMIALREGRRGRVYPVCGFGDCVNPMHMGSVHYWKRQPRDEETGKFKRAP